MRLWRNTTSTSVFAAQSQVQGTGSMWRAGALMVKLTRIAQQQLSHKHCTAVCAKAAARQRQHNVAADAAAAGQLLSDVLQVKGKSISPLTSERPCCRHASCRTRQ
jgi:hypothetical protein